MKILLISDYSVPRGGNEIVTLALRDGLQARGHDARLFASRAHTNGGSDLADYHCFGTGPTTYWRWSILRWTLCWVWRIGRLWTAVSLLTACNFPQSFTNTPSWNSFPLAFI
jgi:hypothetical protein